MISSPLGEGVPSPRVDATNHLDAHPSLVVGVLSLPSQVVQVLLNPIHVEADPTRVAEGGLLDPILLVVLVAISLGAEGPNHQVEVAPILRVAVGLLVPEDPTPLVAEGPILAGQCRKVDRLRLAVPLRVDYVLVPSCFHGSCEQQLNKRAPDATV